MQHSKTTLERLIVAILVIALCITGVIVGSLTAAAEETYYGYTYPYNNGQGDCAQCLFSYEYCADHMGGHWDNTATTHKWVCDDGIGLAQAAHDTNGTDGACSVCGYKPKSHNITNNTTDPNGTVKVKETATVGSPVVVTVEPNAGYALDTLTVTTADGTAVTTKGTHFVMPDSDVTVVATFKEYAITETMLILYNADGTYVKSTSKKTYTYDEYGRETSEIQYNYTNGEFVLFTKSTSTYVGDTKNYTLTKLIDYYTSAGQIQKSAKHVYEYEDGLMIIHKTYNNGAYSNGLKYGYDNYGNQTRQVRISEDGTEAAAPTTYSYTYDANGNVLTKTADKSGVVTTYTYDEYGYQIGSAGGHDKYTYEYDSDGNLSAKILESNSSGSYQPFNKEEYTYFANGLQHTYSYSSYSEGWVKDQYKITYVSHDITNATTDTNGTVKVAESGYSDMPVVVTVEPNAGYVLDTLTVTTADGTAVTTKGTHFVMPDSDVTVVATFKEYAGATYKMSLVNDEFDGETCIKYTYDEYGRVITQIDYRFNGTEFAPDTKCTYVYSGDTKTYTKTETTEWYMTDAWENAGTAVYEYENGLMISEKSYGVSGNFIYWETYTYDDYGNKTGYGYNNENGTQKGSPTTITYTYDVNGNVLTKKEVSHTYTYTYDEYGYETGYTDTYSGKISKISAKEYDSNGNLSSEVINHYNSDVIYATYQYEYTYFADGTLKTQVVSKPGWEGWEVSGTTTNYPGHSITNATTDANGTVTVAEIGYEGMPIIIKVEPDTGYILDTLTVTTADGTAVTTKGTHFVMPDSDVTVVATFKEYAITKKVRFDTDASGAYTAKYTYTYDEYGRQTEAIKYNYSAGQWVLNIKTVSEYDGDAKTYTQTETNYKYESGQWVKLSKIIQEYKDGLQVSYKYFKGDGTFNYWNEYTYDNNGNQTSRTQKNENGTPKGAPLTYTYTYDAIGNMLTSTGSDNSVKTYSYDEYGYAKGHIDTKNGNNSQKYEYRYDSDGNLAVLENYMWSSGDWAESYKIEYTYFEDGSQMTYRQYIYSGGDWTLSSSQTTYLTQEIINGTTDANGAVTVKDAAGIDDLVIVDIKANTGYVFDTMTVTTASGTPVATKGNRFVMPAEDVTVVVTFKAFDPITETVQINYNSSGTYSAKYVTHYDENGNEESQITYNYKNGSWVGSSKNESIYSGTLLTKKVYYTWTGTEWVYSSKYEYEYDGDGNNTSYSIYTREDGQWVNTHTTYYTYDTDGNMKTMTSYKAGKATPSDAYEYTYDANGNMIKKHQSYSASRAVDYNSTYTYDINGNMLTQNIASYSTGTYTYTYDEYGYMSTELYEGSSKSNITYTYDANGNMTQNITEYYLGGVWTAKYKAICTYYADGKYATINNYSSSDNGATWTATTHSIYCIGAHSITNNTADANGTAKVDTEAYISDLIIVDVKANEGYVFDKLTVTDASGNTVETKGNRFVMPDSDVTVVATFKAVTKVTEVSYVTYNANDKPTEKVVTKYNSNGQTTEETSYDYEDGEWVAYKKNTYTYDVDGNETEDLQQKYIDGAWVDYSKTINTYDAAGRHTLYKYSYVEDGTWVTSSKEVYEYAPDGLSGTMTKYSGETEISGFTDYTFDSNGKVVKTTVYNYDRTSVTKSFSTTYDVCGNVISERSKDIDNEYTYDEFGYLVETVEINKTEKSRLVYTIDETGKITSMEMDDWDSTEYVPFFIRNVTYFEDGTAASMVILRYSPAGWTKAQTETGYLAKTITDGTTDENGTVTIDAYAFCEDIVTVTTTPASEDYELAEIKVYKTGDETTTITVTEDGKFVMPDYPVTVVATFKKTNVCLFREYREELIESFKALGEDCKDVVATATKTIRDMVYNPEKPGVEAEDMLQSNKDDAKKIADAVPAALLAARKETYELYKGMLSDNLKFLGEDCGMAIADGKKTLINTPYDETKTLAENRAIVREITDKITDKLIYERSKVLEAYKTDIYAELDALGYDYNNIIADAKTAIVKTRYKTTDDDLDAMKALVRQMADAVAGTLEAAKTEAFETYKLEKIAIVKTFGPENNTVITDAIKEINAVKYDGTVSHEDNTAKIDAIVDAVPEKLGTSNKETFDNYKAQVKKELDALGEDYNNIIANAKAEIDKQTFDGTITLSAAMANVKAIADKAINALGSSKTGLFESYKKEIAASLDNLGEDCDNIIADAKKTISGTAYDNTKTLAENRAAVKAIADAVSENLKAAKTNNFELYKEKLAKKLDSLEDCNNVVANAKKALNALAYDNTKTFAQNTAAADATIANVESDLATAKAEENSRNPQMLDGAKQTIDMSNDNVTAQFRSSANFNEFVKVLMDGAEVPADCYDVKEGSTIVTLHDDYLRTLSEGEHSISIVSTNGQADTTFTVSNQQAASSGSAAVTVIIIVVCVLAVAAAAVVILRKKNILFKK